MTHKIIYMLKSKNTAFCLSMILTVLSSFTVFAQKKSSSNWIYLDHLGQEIDKSNFEKLLDTNSFLDIDSVNYKKLIVRESYGQLSSRAVLEQNLEITLNITIDSTSPIIILYYPGIDPCNSSGNVDANDSKSSYNKLQKTVKKQFNTNALYICQAESELHKSEKLVPWKKDPQRMIEKLFFKHHYPCGSYVVIDPLGRFISYFGEYMTEDIIAHANLLMETEN